MLRKTLAAALTTIALLGTITACSTDAPAPKAAPTKTAAAPKTTTPTPDVEGDTAAPLQASREFTTQAFDYAWGAYTESDRDSMCDTVDQLGPDGAAAAFGTDIDDRGLTDWGYFAELVATECNKR